MPVNRINATLSDEQRRQALAALASLNDALPFLIDLSADERNSMAKFGDKNRSFVVKALAIAENHPEILPRSLDLDELRADVELVESLYPLRNAVEALLGRLDNTYFAAGSEAYVSALLVYQYAKTHNVATGALEESLDDLGRRFSRRNRKSGEGQ